MSEKTSTAKVVGEVEEERKRQEAKWGEQNHPNGTGTRKLLFGKERLPIPWYDRLRNEAIVTTDRRAQMSILTYSNILIEEVFEALAESDPAKLRTELVQVAAVAVAWIEKIDRDKAKAAAGYLKATRMSEHFVTVTSPADPEASHRGQTVKFECRGDRDSKCHYYSDCDCEGWSGEHEREHTFVKHDECWVEGWFEADCHAYDGPDRDDMRGDWGLPAGMNRSGPVSVTFEMEYVSWEFTEASQ